ncbi:MAG: mechanosensitive ion channel family protein [Treponema sp.]|jgi:small-conductance mechanosensitive channel|nr:mechanosensitive ion channel family protein [Treponema sp.]
MRKLSVLIAVFYLLLPLNFSMAQESDLTETEKVSKEDILDSVEEHFEELFSDAGSQSADDGETEGTGFVINLNFFIRLIIVIAIIIVQALLIRLVWFLFKKLNKKIEESAREKIKPLVIKKLKLLTTKQITGVIGTVLRIIKYVVTVLQLFITLPVIFSLFSATRNLAAMLLHYILTEVKTIGLSIGRYIPKLITIIIIVLITRYILRGIKFFASQIEKEKIVIPGFYPDWARPTYKILQVLLWAFTFALIYPYLPGANSRAFQGVSVFIGVIFSIGSTSAIGNLIAGLVITYMRPFKIGDRVQIKETIGFVVEKNLMVVRVKTHKNEYVTFPNVMILGSDIINYNTSSDEDEEGLILYAAITYGYATPWQKIHEILINAALATEYVQKKPKPFVLQTALDNFYAEYQINCYTKDVSKIPLIYSLLFENIQNGFKEAGLDLTTANFQIITKKDK